MKVNFEMESSEMTAIMSVITNAIKAYTEYEKDETKSRYEAEKAKRHEEITGTEKLRKAREILEAVM